MDCFRINHVHLNQVYVKKRKMRMKKRKRRRMIPVMMKMMILKWNNKYPVKHRIQNVNDVVVIIPLKINNLKAVVINKVAIIPI